MIQAQGSTSVGQILVPPTRVRLILSALRYLAGKALTILVTIFTGVFVTMLMVNYPSTKVDNSGNSPFELRLENQIELFLDVSLYRKTFPFDPTAGPLDQQVEAWREQIRDEAGLNLPFWPRNLLWTVKAVSFDWGTLNPTSLKRIGFGQKIKPGWNDNLVLQSLPNSLLLVGSAYLLVFLLGMPLSLYLARNHGNRIDRLITFLSPVSSVPSWVFAFVLIALFAVQLRWLPTGGMFGFHTPQEPLAYLLTLANHMLLPVSALVLSLLFQLVYVWRTFFIIFSEEDYVELAKAKGLTNKVLEKQHILRPALPYIITSFTTSLIGFWQLTVALEKTFQWPGIGLLYLKVLPNYWRETVEIGDLMVVIQIVVVFAYLLGILVFLLDLVYVIVDPRIHLTPATSGIQTHARVKAKSVFGNRHPTARMNEKSRGHAPPVPGPEMKRSYSLSEIRLGLSEACTRTRLFFRELRTYPSAVFGLIVIVILLAGSLYAVIALPYEQFGRAYDQSWVSGHTAAPRVAAPIWFNYFSRTPRLSTLIMDETSREAGVSTRVLDNGWIEKTVTFKFDYAYSEMPTEMFLHLMPTFTGKFPFASMIWTMPDGRSLALKSAAVSGDLDYDFKSGLAVPRLLNENPVWLNWFVTDGQYPTPEFKLLFAEPGSPQPTPQAGTYQLEIKGLFFEEDDDLQTELILLGQVYGMAGTDFWRRDLTVPLFWGMPFALIIGLLGTFITTLIAMLLPAAGVWFGGWLDAFIQRLTEVNMVLPGLAIAVLANLLFGTSIWIVLGFIVLLNAFGSPIKTFRSAFLQAKEAPYIEAALSYGAGNLRIITRYLVPRILPVFIPQLVSQIPGFIFLEATLGFFNINSNYPSWGRIIYQGLSRGALYGSPFWVLEPISLLLLTGLAFAMLGSALERILNPRVLDQVPESVETKPPRKAGMIPAISALVVLLVVVNFIPIKDGKSPVELIRDSIDPPRSSSIGEINTPVLSSSPTTTASLPTRTSASLSGDLSTPTPFLPPTPTSVASCIPANPPVAARIVEIIDGNTVKVLMNDLVYVVRYIGVGLPQDHVDGANAFRANSELVFRREITLIADVSDKDSSGRLLRYIMAGDTFVNWQLLQDGQGISLDVPPNSACVQEFKSAEQSAVQSARGLWAPP